MPKKRSSLQSVLAFTLPAFGAAALLLVLVVTVTNGPGGFSESTAAAAFGWTVPLIAGTLVGITAWLLLSRSPSARHTANSRRCDACGANVQSQWRLCPHCGAILGSASDPERSESAS